MIGLLEHEGKEILRRHGLDAPPGAMFPALPGAGGGPFVVKAQVPVGGRGKAGGIRFADTREAVAQAAAALQDMTIGGEAVRSVWVEQRLLPVRELYLAAMVDRNAGVPVILACARGGVDIETVPTSEIARFPVDPLVGLRGYTVAAVARHLGGGVEAAVRAVHAALVAEDAELVEVNPLMVDAEGGVWAADAKIALDEDAAFRHPGRRAMPDGSAFERAARDLGTVGIELDGGTELDGGIAAMMNGAGMTMATLDQLTALGGSVRALVELHGVMAHGPARIAEVIALMLALRPKVLLLNVYFQFRSLDVVAEGLARAIARNAAALPPVVVRFRGVAQAQAQQILAPLGCFLTDDFAVACARAVALAA